MQYSYTCKTIDGKIEKGVIEAPNEQEASKELHGKKLFVLSLGQEKQSLPGAKKAGLSLNLTFNKKISLKDKIIFTQQLAMMVKSGLPLLDSFSALEEQTENKTFSKIIVEIASDVKGGKALSESLAKYPKVFPELYIAMVSSGEKSGKLDEVLERLAEQLQKDYDLITKVKAAVSYPIVVVTALILIGIIMLIFVVPQLKSIFADIGAELPLITRIVLGLADAMRTYWYIFVIVILGIYFAIRYWVGTPAGRFTYDRIKLKLPIAGPIIRKIYIARFSRTMGSLVASGLPMLDIIATVKGVINNRVYESAFEKISRDVEGGIPLSVSIKNQKIFPPMIYHLISVGEKSGKLDYVLLSTATFFDKEVEASTNNMATLIEPVLIIIVGAAVGLVVASVLMPIYSLVNSI